MEGVDSGSDLGSGDEEHLEKKKHRGKSRLEPRLRDEAFIFDGETFTDESNDDGVEVEEEEEEEEEEENAVDNWLKSFKPSRFNPGHHDDIIDKFLKNAKRSSKGGEAEASSSSVKTIRTHVQGQVEGAGERQGEGTRQGEGLDETARTRDERSTTSARARRSSQLGPTRTTPAGQQPRTERGSPERDPSSRAMGDV